MITILVSITSCKIGSNKSSLITSTIISAIKSIDYSKLGVFTIIKNSDYSYSGCINGNKFIYYHHTGSIDFLGHTPTISEMDQVKYGIFVLENYNLHTIKIERVFNRMGFPANWKDLAKIERSSDK